MTKRQKAAPFDGLGPRERKKIDSAIRQVWYRCKARALAVKRCTDKQGFTRCEKCKKRTPKIKVDHITPCGPVDSDGFMTRLFCPSSQLQCLCHECHKPKTKAEAAARKLQKALDEKGIFIHKGNTKGDSGVIHYEHPYMICYCEGQGPHIHPFGVKSDPPKKKSFCDSY